MSENTSTLTFTESQLRNYDGENGSKYIAFEGIVYEVTDCPNWRREMHQNLHFPGQDLTNEISDAPHGKEVFQHPNIKQIGILLTKPV